MSVGPIIYPRIQAARRCITESADFLQQITEKRNSFMKSANVDEFLSPSQQASNKTLTSEDKEKIKLYIEAAYILRQKFYQDVINLQSQGISSITMEKITNLWADHGEELEKYKTKIGEILEGSPFLLNGDVLDEGILSRVTKDWVKNQDYSAMVQMRKAYLKYAEARATIKELESLQGTGGNPKDISSLKKFQEIKSNLNTAMDNLRAKQNDLMGLKDEIDNNVTSVRDRCNSCFLEIEKCKQTIEFLSDQLTDYLANASSTSEEALKESDSLDLAKYKEKKEESERKIKDKCDKLRSVIEPDKAHYPEPESLVKNTTFNPNSSLSSASINTIERIYKSEGITKQNLEKLAAECGGGFKKGSTDYTLKLPNYYGGKEISTTINTYEHSDDISGKTYLGKLKDAFTQAGIREGVDRQAQEERDESVLAILLKRPKTNATPQSN